MIDALKRGSAKRITAVLPFYPYARQDKKHRGREPISARLIADLFKTAGADRIMTVDLHTDQIQGFFDGPVDHMRAQPLLTGYIAEQLRRRRHDGGLPRFRPGAGRGEMGRPARRRAAGLHPQDPRPAGAQPGEVATGSSVTCRGDLHPDRRHDRHRRHHRGRGQGAEGRRRRRRGHRRHPRRAVRSRRSGWPSCGAREVVVTNTLPIGEDKQFPQLTVLSIAPLLASTIRAVFENGSVTGLFDGSA